MFEVEGVSYTLKFNKQKLKTIELSAKTSVIGEIIRKASGKTTPMPFFV